MVGYSFPSLSHFIQSLRFVHNKSNATSLKDEWIVPIRISFVSVCTFQKIRLAFHNGDLLEIDVFKHVAKLRPFVHKIILQKYISQWIDLT